MGSSGLSGAMWDKGRVRPKKCAQKTASGRSGGWWTHQQWCREPRAACCWSNWQPCGLPAASAVPGTWPVGALLGLRLWGEPWGLWGPVGGSSRGKRPSTSGSDLVHALLTTRPSQHRTFARAGHCPTDCSVFKTLPQPDTRQQHAQMLARGGPAGPRSGCQGATRRSRGAPCVPRATLAVTSYSAATRSTDAVGPELGWRSDFAAHYAQGKCLGGGSFGVVYSGVDRIS